MAQLAPPQGGVARLGILKTLDLYSLRQHVLPMASTDQKKLAFGIICQGTTFPAFQAECIRALIGSGVAGLKILILEDSPPGTPIVEGPSGTADHILFDVYTRLWVQRRSRAHRPVSLERECRDLPRLRCAVPGEGQRSGYFRPEDVDEIRRHGLDFILHFGLNPIRGEILEAAQYGVWAYEHDYRPRPGGGPPCFWEVANGDPITRVVLQRLMDEPGAGTILHQGYFRTAKTYVRNAENVCLGSTDWCVRVCNEVRLGQVPRVSGNQTRIPPSRVPTNSQFLRFFAKQAFNVVEWLWMYAFHVDMWNVALLETPIRELIREGRPKQPRWMKPRGHLRYIADPHGLNVDGKLKVLVEDFDYLVGRGMISEFTLPDALTDGNIAPVLKLPHHMSYPCVFTTEGRTYLVPETYEARKVLMFERDFNLGGWKSRGILLDDVAAVDPTVFEHMGLWWLLCGDNENRGDTKLHAWYAESLDGPWKAHPLNPLKTDVRSARPAGRLFEIDGALYRPAQDCSRTYGGAVTINEVIKLTPTEFEEIPRGQILPDPTGPYPDGIHTLCPVGDLTIIDGKKITFSILGPIVRLRKRPAR